MNMTKNLIESGRSQLYSRLADAMTIHKTLRSTLIKVAVNWEKCSQPGQVEIAVGREDMIELCLFKLTKTYYVRNIQSMILAFMTGENQE